MTTPASRPVPCLTWRRGAPLPVRWPDLGSGQRLRLRLGARPADGFVLRLGPALTFRVDVGAPSAVLRAELSIAGESTPYAVAVPLSALAASGGELVLEYRRHRLSLWLDGVLVDEEWPMGEPAAGDGEPGLDGTVDAIDVWTDAESGGATWGGAADARAVERILGPAAPVGQGWRPRGFNVAVGDCMPFFHDGVFHLFYLLDRRHHRSKRGLGAHEWAHASTRDLRQWTEHPPAVRIEAEIEGSICTGSLVFHGGRCHAFYTVRMADRSPAPICRAVSADGVNFTRAGAVAELGGPYQPDAGRDPMVFRDAGSGRFHLLVTTSLVEADGRPGRGCLAHLVSADLVHWEPRPPFFTSDDAEQPECPDWFEWNGWHYLVFSLRGIARYRMSRQPLGPWTCPADDALDGETFRVMKTAAFTGGRRLGAAFAAPAGEYGGTLVVRELHQRADGTLRGDWPAEMPPAPGGA